MKTSTRHTRRSGFCLGALATLFLLSVPASSQVSRSDLAKSIDTKKLRHPYLFFDENEKKQIRQRIENDKESRKIMDALLAEGHRFLYVPVKHDPPLPPKNPRFTAERDEATQYAREISRGAVTLAFLYQMTGEMKYAKKAAEFALAICDLQSWVNPAHVFDIIYPRVWPWNVPDDQVVFSYDITAAGRSVALATAYDWLYPVLTKEQKDKIRGALLDRAITRVRGNYDFQWWSSSYRCNWTAICFSGLGVTALSLLTEHPEILDVAAESYSRMTLTFNELGVDGGWQEGRGYWGYMMRESVMFMDALKRMSGGKYNLFQHERIKNNPVDFVLYTLTANFEDSGGGPVGSTNSVNKLVAETGNATAAWYRETFLDEGDDIFDILWPRSSVRPVEPKEKSKLFRTINWAVMRSDFLDRSSVTIACKAGYNDDPHHGHLARGQFILTWQGAPFIRDIGRMEYDEQYFNEDRWIYPYASSAGHNLIFVNDEQQITAKLKNQPWKKGIGGDILKFESSDKRDYVLMDPTGAYPGKELKKWRRSIVLDKPVVTLVLDEVESETGAKIEARFFPGIAPGVAAFDRRPGFPRRPSVDYKILSDHVVLSSQDKYHLVLIPIVLNGTFTIAEDELPAVAVREDARLDWIPYFGAITKAQSTVTIIATVIVPVDQVQNAEMIVKSAKIAQPNRNQVEVSVTIPEGTYRWLFERDSKGFILKN